MGLFGKKKEKISETKKVFDEYGVGTNEVQVPATRKQTRSNAEQQRTSQIKKDQLLEQLSALRKKMYNNPDFDRYTDMLEEQITKLKGMEDNSNKQALESVDGFILAALREATDYCNRGNYVAMGAVIDNLEGFINDRYRCGNYYTDPKFCKFKLERNRLYVEQQAAQSQYDKLVARLEQLKADMHNPNLHISKENIVREATRIKEEGQRIKRQLDEYESRIGLLDKGLDEIQSSNSISSSEFDIVDEFDDVIGLKREHEDKQTIVDKLNDKMDESHRKISASSLNVNEETINSRNRTTEVSDDFFEMP